MSGSAERPYVWQMVKEAIQALGSPTTNVAVKNWILRKYAGTNLRTIRCHIIICTVNHPSRVHYPQNKKPRAADGPYDFLFRPARGVLELYDPDRHGRWEIAKAANGVLSVGPVTGRRRKVAVTDARRLSGWSPPSVRPTPGRRRQEGRYDQIQDTNLKELLANFRPYYRQSLAVSRSFGGPSVFFHREAIEAAKTAFLSDGHLKAIYAVLPAWGMHRMGDTKTKMVEFDEFRSSALASRQALGSMRDLHLASAGDAVLQEALDGPMRDAFTRLRVSVSDAAIVANSKALHHILPNLVPPMDRQHTMRFFYYRPAEFVRVTPGGKAVWRMIMIPKPLGRQYQMFRDLLLGVRAIVTRPELTAIRPLREPDAPFNTSLPKVADNMVVAFVRAKGKKLGL